MGLFNKVQSSLTSKPVPVAVSPWFDQFAGDPLARETAVSAALGRLMFRTQVGATTSFWSGPNERLSDPATRLQRASRVMLRVEQVSASKVSLSCGAWGWFGFSEDWQLRVDMSDPADSWAGLLSSRQLDNAICNEDLFKQVRAEVVAELSHPTLRLHRHAGPPEPAVPAQVPEPSSADGLYSPFTHDYVVPLPAGFGHGWTVDLPDLPEGDLPFSGGAAALPLAAVPGGQGWDLSSGRGGVGVWLLMGRRPGGGATLTLSCQKASWDELVATRFTLIGLLELLRIEWREQPWPGTLAALSAAGQQLRAGWTPQDRDSFIEARAGGRAVQVPLDAEALVPVQMTLTSSRALPDTTMLCLAAAGVWSYERFFAKGWRQKSQEESLQHMCRRLSVVVDDEGKRSAYWRFGHSMAFQTPRPLLPRVQASDPWAWEAEVTSGWVDEGRWQMTVRLTGLCRVGDEVGHGRELVDFLRGVHAAALHVDPGVVADTVSVRV